LNDTEWALYASFFVGVASYYSQGTTMDVFISYSTMQLDVAIKAKLAIEATGSTAFLAEHHVAPGEGLTDRIVQEIKACRLFVLLWSSHSRGSEWVQREVGMARQAEKIVVPVKLDAEAELPGFLQDIKYVPAFRGLESALESLQNAMAAHGLGQAKHGRPVQRPMKGMATSTKRNSDSTSIQRENELIVAVSILALCIVLVIAGSKG
jgi:hypothetical protein